METSKVQSGAPSPALRKWYSHDVSRWPEFQRRYRQELDQNPEAWRPILDLARSRQVTLLDEALSETFPASDPVAVSCETAG